METAFLRGDGSELSTVVAEPKGSHAVSLTDKMSPQQTLRQCVERVVRDHLLLMGNHDPEDFYRFVLDEVEPPLIAEVLKRTRGNQSRAAKILGLNRGTLRKKIQQFGL